MKKHWKKILLSILIILTVGVGVGAYMVGDYFVDYALARKDIDFDDPLSPTYDKPQAEIENRAIADIAVNTFLQTTPPAPISITSFDDLSLTGHVLEYPGSDLWVIIVHGYTSSYDTGLDFATEFYNRGYSVILPELRAHGSSEGDYMTMGYYDSKDILSWIEVITKYDETARIVLHGISMGAATVMMAAGDEELPYNIVAVIEDCGYTDAYQMFAEQLKARFGLPSFPLLNIAAMVGEQKAGFNLKDTRPITALENATVPILFIHGDEDGFVLPYMGDELYSSYTGPKEKLIIEGADHGAARYVNPTLYYETLFNFIDDAIAGNVLSDSDLVIE